MSCIFDEDLGMPGVDAFRQFEVRANVVFHAIGHGMPMIGIETASVPKISIEHQEYDAVVATIQQAFGRDIQILFDPRQIVGPFRRSTGFIPRFACFSNAAASLVRRTPIHKPRSRPTGANRRRIA